MTSNFVFIACLSNKADAAAAITLRREMLNVIQHKFPDFSAFDDLQWPLMTPNGSPLPRPSAKSRTETNLLSGDDDDDDVNNKSFKEYWEIVRKKYESQLCDEATLLGSHLDILPENWTIMNISIAEDKNTMFVCRQQAHSEPLIFCIPLKGRRETADDEHLTFDDTLNELRNIIIASDKGTRQAVHVKNDDPKARSAWWAERIALDLRMKELLENIEFCWLGAFKV